MQYESEQLTFDHEKLTPCGIYSYLRGIDSSLHELKDEYYESRREDRNRMSRMEEELST